MIIGYPNQWLPPVKDVYKFFRDAQEDITYHFSHLLCFIEHLLCTYLSWLIDLAFHVPMQNCSLQHWILLPSPVTYPTGHCFRFSSASSLFLELFLHSSPVAYWALTNRGVHLSVSYLFAFSYCSWGSQGKNTKAVCHSLLQWTTFCQNSPC